jgi:ABC-type phosphate transport system auxiliary subunit
MSNMQHLRRMATVASNEDEDALLWALLHIERLEARIDARSDTLELRWQDVERLEAEVERLKDENKQRVSAVTGELCHEVYSAAVCQRAELRAEVERLRAEAVLLRREIALMRTLVVQDENARAALEPKP